MRAPPLFAKLSVIVCLNAASATLAMNLTSGEPLAPLDALAVLYDIGPYLALTVLVWLKRRSLVASGCLLAIVCALAGWGLYVHLVDWFGYRSDPTYRDVQRTAIVVVPAVQWVAAAALTVVTLVARQISRKGPPEGVLN